MRHKLAVLAVLAAFSVGGVAAQSQEVDAKPGFVTPGSPLYGLETAMDSAAVDVGLAKASKVAQERAAEAEQAAEKGNYNRAQQAANQMGKIAKKAKGNQTQGLQKAESVLQRVMENAPEEAQQGLQNALQNVQTERERVQRESGQPDTPGEQPAPGGETVQQPDNTTGDQDDTGGFTGSGDVDTNTSDTGQQDTNTAP